MEVEGMKFEELTPPGHPHDPLDGRSFYCAGCGATVDGGRLELHARWHKLMEKIANRLLYLSGEPR